MNGISCVLLHNRKQVCYASKSKSPVECNYGQIDKEFLAIWIAFYKFYQFVYGQKATVQTDYLPLISLI